MKHKTVQSKNAARTKHTGSIEHKLSRSLMFMTVAVAGILIIANISALFISNTSLLDKGSTTTVQGACTYAERVLDLLAMNARALTSSDALQDSSLPREERIMALRSIVRKNKYIEAGYLDKSGKGFSNNGEVDYSDNPIFENAKKGETYLSAPGKFGSSNRICIVAGAPIYDKYGAGIIGTVYVAQDANEINDKMMALSFGESGYAYVLDANGSIIYHPNKDIMMSQENPLELAKTDAKYNSQAAAITKILQNHEGTSSYKDKNGISMYCVYKPINNYENWTLVLTAPKSEFLGVIQKSAIVSVLIAAIFSLAAMLLLRYAMRKMVKPASIVQTRLDALSGGDVTGETLVMDTGDELGEISYSLNITVEHLHGYLNRLSSVLNSVADGDMTTTIDNDFEGDFAQLQTSIVSIIHSFNQTLLGIEHTVSEVTDGAQMVSDGAQTLSNGANEQASAVTQLSLTVKDIKSSIEQAELYAGKAGEEATATGNELTKTSTQMNNMIAAMDEIGHKAEQIGDIIKTIESIAFETNLLALNAAVEAAHAGSDGQGFAVVANEVRALAAQSAKAASSTTALIRESVESIENGVALARTTSEGMNSVMSDAVSIVKSIQSLSSAAKEQTKTVNNIANEVDKISAVVSINSKTATTSADASARLLTEAQKLTSILSRFTLNNNCYDDLIQNAPDIVSDDIDENIDDIFLSSENLELNTESEAVTL
ncbi:MAG: methyl-accepting chemotaxis protein [Oscillospiraceae bacterium]